MSENLNELCCCLVGEFYGSFHQRLFAQLVQHGRLSASQIAQRTHIPLKQIKSGLSVLVQSRLIYHHTNQDGFSTYQANITTTYELLRYGRIVELARKHLGDLAASIVSEAIFLGFSSIAELEIRTGDVWPTNHPDSMIRGSTKGLTDPKFQNEVQETIEALLDEGYLYYVRSAHFQTDIDTKTDVERKLVTTHPTQTQRTKKANHDMHAQVDVEVRSRISTENIEYGHVPAIQLSQKRSLEDGNEQPDSKRQKLHDGNRGEVNGHFQPASISNHKYEARVVCVSSANLVRSIRDDMLVSKARKIVGTGCSEVFAKALAQTSGTTRWSMTKEHNAIDIHEVQHAMNAPTDIIPYEGHKQNGTTKINGNHGNSEVDFNEQRISYNQVDRNLALLADSEFHFLQGSSGHEWYIAKKDMDTYLRQLELLRLMADRLQPPALRIIQMLMDKGKLDEKTLQEIGLLGAKELRQKLAQLKQMGYVDLQEVPRESQRQPNRTIFLWFHDPNRVSKVLLDSLYKAMARLMQRLDLERKKIASTLEKVERSDVQGNEEQIMSSAELKVLRRWQRVEHWLLGELARLDNSVTILRDL